MVFLLLPVSFFILGVVTIIVAECAVLWLFICRLNRKLEKTNNESSIAPPIDINPSSCDKEGELWILEPEKVPKLGVEDKERKRKDIVEIAPVHKHARIKDQYLIITDKNSPRVEILLKGCIIVAVSATNLPTRKWAKRYPIKIERKDTPVYKGHNSIYIYLETSWDKELWCKALRLASCVDEQKILWFSKMSVQFHNYLASLNAGYPSFMKPYGHIGAELVNKPVKLDNPSSKVRQFLKKLGRKGSKGGQEYKASESQNLGLEDRKFSERSRSFQDDSSVTSSVSSSCEPESGNRLAGIFAVDLDHTSYDEGALCFSLIISRLFFDVKDNVQIVKSIQNRIQRAISNMRIPSYIGAITCTAVDPGNLPPRILSMRFVPSDMNEVWALEIDVEYLGGASLDIETRLEIQELEEARFDTNTAGVVSSDLMEGIEYLEEELKLSNETGDERKQKDEGDSVPDFRTCLAYNFGSSLQLPFEKMGDVQEEINKSDALKDKDEKEDSKSTAGAHSQVPKWKSVLHSITKQVSQVPISLGIGISSIHGTVRLSMKPPPSDQIWFAFSSMPDIEFNLDSYIGERKITNGHLALFLINRFKAGVRDTLVLPNRDSISIPGMLAEKDDWVPRKVAPFMWYRPNNDSTNNTAKKGNPVYQTCEPKHTVETKHTTETKHANSDTTFDKSESNGQTPQVKPNPSPLSSVDEELRASRKEKDEFSLSNTEISMRSRSIASSEGQTSEDDEARLTRIGTRERVLGLRKRMGEKLEAKRRHAEEKGRSLFERMRGP